MVAAILAAVLTEFLPDCGNKVDFYWKLNVSYHFSFINDRDGRSLSHPQPFSQIGRGEKNVDRENLKIGII
ncbi:hypothetical protein [Hydrococcus rivularis]|uniref:hypothetical protein n=1 Tax=Hydrococcus rivularis TaxID=1616834 RepID=UPI0015881185|nr:hypothetical protein [Hydrococcus rivularis]